MSSAEILVSINLGLIYSLVALGIFFTFRILNFTDLTCDGSFVCGAATSSVLIMYGIHPAIALLIALFAGGACGLITSFVHLYGKVPEVLSGILVSFMLYSINLRIMNYIPNITLDKKATLFNYASPLYLLIGIVSLITISVFYLFLTHWGLALRAVGINKRLSAIYGIHIDNKLIAGLIISNALIACAGALLSQYQLFVDISQGVGTIIFGLAAVLIGEKLCGTAYLSYALIGCVVGAIIYRLIIALALNMPALGCSPSDINLITGFCIMLIMQLPAGYINKQRG